MLPRETGPEFFRKEAPPRVAPKKERKIATPPTDIRGYPIMPPASVGTGSNNWQNLLTTTHAEPPNRSNASLLGIPSRGGSRLCKIKASRTPQAIESARTELLN